MKNLILSAILASCMFFISCGGSDSSNCTAQQFNTEVNSTIMDLNAAAQVYVNDPSSENCEAYKDAANEYLKVIEGFESCNALTPADYEQALQQAKDSVDAIAC